MYSVTLRFTNFNFHDTFNSYLQSAPENQKKQGLLRGFLNIIFVFEVFNKKFSGYGNFMNKKFFFENRKFQVMKLKASFITLI